MSKRQSFDYTAQLRLEYEELRKKVRSGMLPLVARVPAIEEAVKTYVEALDSEFERKRAKAIAEGRSVNTVPIPYRDERLLHQLADLVMYEELTWSHPDKMSIVEYPVMSDTQERERLGKTSFPGEISFRDRQHNGRRKSFRVGKNGDMKVANNRIANMDGAEYVDKNNEIDVGKLLSSANLTDRQREAVDLVYFKDLTQETAAQVMGIKKPAINEHLAISLRKMREKTELLTN